MNITYRSVREWVCETCGTVNYTPENDIKEDGVAVCCRCLGEVEDGQFIEEVEEC